jgi:hypothetical protein
MDISIKTVLPSTWFYFSLLGEPINRTLSHILFFTGHLIRQKYREPQLSDEEIIEIFFNKPIMPPEKLHNFQVKTFIRNPSAPITMSQLEEAKETIFGELNFFGIKERYQDVLKCFGLQGAGPRMPRDHASKVSPERLAMLHEILGYDILLYEAALQEFDQRYADQWSVDSP